MNKKTSTIWFVQLCVLCFVFGYLVTDMPNPRVIIGILISISIFCSIYMKDKQAYDGKFEASLNEDGNLRYTLELTADPESFAKKGTLVFQRAIPIDFENTNL